MVVGVDPVIKYTPSQNAENNDAGRKTQHKGDDLPFQEKPADGKVKMPVGSDHEQGQVQNNTAEAAFEVIHSRPRIQPFKEKVTYPEQGLDPGLAIRYLI
ncbi:hypothetical protein FQZ97_1214810 [compost metagenome]